VIALILVARIHKPTMRAVAFARATRPSLLEAVTVAVDDRETERLQQEWADMGMPVPLTVLPSPFREINSPVIAYVTRLRAQWPDSLLAIYLPEYVVEHWWDRLLHNQSAARLKRRLTALQNVVVISVPYQMRSAALADAGHGARPPAAGITGLTAELPRIDPAHPPVPGEPAAPSAGPRPQP
jgi:hypothetical protein